MRIVLLNGPPGVGKTTIGRRLAATARNGICIHGDDLKHFVVTRDPNAVATGLSYTGGAALAAAFLAGGYELVVFEFVFPTPKQVKRFQHALPSDAPVQLLTLWAPLTTVTAREAGRIDRESLGTLVTESWRELFANLGALGAVVDASPPVDDVVAGARRAVDEGAGLLASLPLAA